MRNKSNNQHDGLQPNMTSIQNYRGLFVAVVAKFRVNSRLLQEIRVAVDPLVELDNQANRIVQWTGFCSAVSAN